MAVAMREGEANAFAHGVRVVTPGGHLELHAAEAGRSAATTDGVPQPDRIAEGRTAATIIDAVTSSSRQARLVSANCWPAELVQLSCLAETSRQLKLIGDWRISDVPLICTDVGLVSV